MPPIKRVIECTAYCSCGYCCNWEWGLKLPGAYYVGLSPSWVPLRIRRKSRRRIETGLPLLARYWTATSQLGEGYRGLTANGRMPGQARPPIFSRPSLEQAAKIPGRILLFPWRFLPRHGTIAADTVHYPFGTRMYVPGYGWGEVEDRGGAIKGAFRIDLYHHSHRDALQWGRRKVQVVVVLPGQSPLDLMRAPKPVKVVLKAFSWLRGLLF
eukprot:SM000005S17283  [mRNA]  locus=s5:1272177:1274316:+ [translate_table: standard]